MPMALAASVALPNLSFSDSRNCAFDFACRSSVVVASGSVVDKFCAPPCEVLPPLDDDVAVRGIKFHEERFPASLFCADERRTAPAEEVKNVLPRTRGV